jgi:hypothetical protein
MLAALIACALLAACSDDDADDRPARAHAPTTQAEAEELVRSTVSEDEPAADPTCARRGSGWDCTWRSPGRSCEVTITRGDRELFAVCNYND